VRARLPFRANVCGCVIALALIAAGLSACGGDAGSTVVVRVGDKAITKAMVDHWTSVISREGPFTGFRGEPRGAPKQRALIVLISSSWLIGEAEREGLDVSGAVVDEAFAGRELEGGGVSYRKKLRQLGKTIADVKLELRAELALEAIRRALTRRSTDVSSAEVASFYRRDPSSFGIPEARVVDLAENLPSPEAATALVKRVGIGKRFTKVGGYHELVLRNPGLMSTPDKVRLVNEIFAARPGVVSRPLPFFFHRWVIFVVRKVIPARALPLAKVRGQVAARLKVSRKRELAARFDAEYRDRWGRHTHCLAGYVVPGCVQHGGSLGTYEDPFST
jgi:hypothetical protein